MYIDLREKFQLFLSHFNATLIFSKHFRKMFKYKILRKSVQWEPWSAMRADGRTNGQTDRHDEVAFRSFINLSKIY